MTRADALEMETMLAKSIMIENDGPSKGKRAWMEGLDHKPRAQETRCWLTWLVSDRQTRA